MAYKYKDVQEFQKLYKTRAEREKALDKLSDSEIWHLAKTAETTQGGAYYASHIRDKEKYRKG